MTRTLYNINVNNFIQVLQEVNKMAKELSGCADGFADCEKEETKELFNTICGQKEHPVTGTVTPKEASKLLFNQTKVNTQ